MAMKIALMMIMLALFTSCGPEASPSCDNTAEDICDAARDCGNSLLENQDNWDRCYQKTLTLCDRYGPGSFTATCEALETCTWGPVGCEAGEP